MTSVDHTVPDTATPETFISHLDMREHLAAGRAAPLSQLITDHASYKDSWWLADRAGWHLITDDVLSHKLTNLSRWVNGNLYLGGK